MKKLFIQNLTCWGFIWAQLTWGKSIITDLKHQLLLFLTVLWFGWVLFWSEHALVNLGWACSGICGHLVSSVETGWVLAESFQLSITWSHIVQQDRPVFSSHEFLESCQTCWALGSELTHGDFSHILGVYASYYRLSQN